ncbi:hypothetical protein EDC17_103536 [Sphingobacterium alimentarium]|uniref:Uncharacterized protein n=1 Tax=Sphingobacterium alimentarium TaxID=797292 RepID=A0A4R3VUQ7_9SPHI|nr:hypothetical protein EDC17_103536 [Sphingobacterium alimentarium]
MQTDLIKHKSYLFLKMKIVPSNERALKNYPLKKGL